MMDEVETELQRSRWRRLAAGMRLEDPESEDFSTGGLARLVAEPSVRLIVIPADPESTFLDFDGEFWEWWLASRPDPSDGRADRWSGGRTTAGAAIRYAGTEREMDGYLALHRSGILELEMGQGGALSARDGKRYFRLTYSVGQIWSALAFYQEAKDRLGLPGPWEVRCALRNTSGAILSNFGEGWAEPGQGFHHEQHVITEPNLLARRELHEWPDADGTRGLAFSFGAWIEDAWGYRYRRFLARQGAMTGQFDTSAYRRYF